jgi:ABC-type antimicrobial peptide transport system permease subunit
MSISTIILKELFFRPWQMIATCLGVAVAVAFVILSISQLRQFDVETNQVIFNQEKEIRKLSDLFKSGMWDKTAFDADSVLSNIKRGLDGLHAQKQGLFGVLVPLAVLACAFFAGIMFFVNARQRRGEFGVFRAIGFRKTHIVQMVVGRALIIGCIGAAIGILTGLVYAPLPDSVGTSEVAGTTSLFDPLLLGLILCVTPVFTAIVAWAPALAVMNDDPALIVKGE